MEENKEIKETKEKKRHGRRRHYRGKNNDKAKDQEIKSAPAGSGEKHEKGEKPEKNEKREKPVKKDRRDRQGKRGRKEEKKLPDTNDAPEDIKPEETAEKPKHEPDEVIFEFVWADAWGLYGTGYHLVIKDNPEKQYLSWSVDLKYDEMKIGQRLQEFLDDLKKCGLSSWDGHRYTKPGIFDGDTWSVKINSLKLKCEAQGTNEYPAEWKQFLQCLHEKWKIPVSKREQWE